MTTSGGISGAITDIESEEALLHAIKRYMFFRSINYDVDKIAENTGYEKQKIRLIKEYLFFEKIIKNQDGEFVPFDPSFAIASSWDRLTFEPNKIQHHDKILLEHELYEISLYCQGYSQDEAHELATKKFDYKTESLKYYEKLRKSQKKKFKETPITFKTTSKNCLISLIVPCPEGAGNYQK